MNFLSAIVLLPGLLSAAAASEPVPAINELLRAHDIPASAVNGLVAEREVYARAKLSGRRYSVLNAMVVHAGLARTKAVVTQFDRFAGNIPYIEKSEWNASRRQLLIAGGIWKYQLQATLQFEEKSASRWEFRVIQGHFLGMRGALDFESAGPGRTLVVFSGALEADRFPPRWVIERGAEIVFAVTGRRVRNWIEDPDYGRQQTQDPVGSGGVPVPSPRKRLGGT